MLICAWALHHISREERRHPPNPREIAIRRAALASGGNRHRLSSSLAANGSAQISNSVSNRHSARSESHQFRFSRRTADRRIHQVERPATLCNPAVTTSQPQEISRPAVAAKHQGIIIEDHQLLGTTRLWAHNSPYSRLQRACQHGNQEKVGPKDRSKAPQRRLPKTTPT